jgi:hypothetical protein
VQLEIDLDHSVHRTGNVWHVQLESLEQYSRYGYRCKVCVHVPRFGLREKEKTEKVFVLVVLLRV